MSNYQYATSTSKSIRNNFNYNSIKRSLNVPVNLRPGIFGNSFYQLPLPAINLNHHWPVNTLLVVDLNYINLDSVLIDLINLASVKVNDRQFVPFLYYILTPQTAAIMRNNRYRQNMDYYRYIFIQHQTIEFDWFIVIIIVSILMIMTAVIDTKQKMYY